MRRWIPADRRRRSSTTAPARPVQLTTADGVPLSGIHLPAHGEAYAPAVVIAHGLTHATHYPTTRAVIDRAARHFSVIALDFRGHGRSGGRSTVGKDEHLDLDAAVGFAREQGHDPVTVIGFSLGGAAAIRQAACGTNPPDGVVAISTPSQWYIRETISMRRVHWMLEHPAGPFVGRRIGVRLGDPWDRVPPSPLESIGAITVPVLLVHGIADHYFGHAHSVALHRAAPGSELWLEPAMTHAETGTPLEVMDRIAGWISDRIVRSGPAIHP